MGGTVRKDVYTTFIPREIEREYSNTLYKTDMDSSELCERVSVLFVLADPDLLSTLPKTQPERD